VADFNIVRLFGGLVEGSLLAKFEVLGANDWKVIFDNITFKGEPNCANL
jgi:hypothetical protein